MKLSCWLILITVTFLGGKGTGSLGERSVYAIAFFMDASFMDTSTQASEKSLQASEKSLQASEKSLLGRALYRDQNSDQNHFEVVNNLEFSRIRHSGIIIKSKDLVGVSIIIDQQTHIITASDLMSEHHHKTAESYQKIYLAMDKGVYALSLLDGDDWLLKTRVFLNKGQTKEILVRR
jgi:hypothetical protein